jgi:plastocyanin
MTRLCALVVVAVAAATFAAPASSRRHRLHLPLPPLPRSLAVDEQEWSVIPSQTVVAAGTVRFTAYDRGMDAHDMQLIAPNGRVLGTVFMEPGSSAKLTASLQPGTYRLICSLFAGTPESHEARGMHSLLLVR